MSDAESYADRMIKNAMANITGEIDFDVASRTEGNCFQALESSTAIIAKRMKEIESGTVDANVTTPILAKMISHITKSVDECYRLLQFADGKPDSRPDAGASLLALLTPEQLGIFNGWIEENRKAAKL